MSQVKRNVKVEIDVKQMPISRKHCLLLDILCLWLSSLFCNNPPALGVIQMYYLGLSVPKSAIHCTSISCGTLY